MRSWPLLLCFMIGIAGAHHSIAKFDPARVVKITGTVTEFRWINPHVVFELDDPGSADSRATHWAVEMQAPNMMMETGWTRDTLAVGERITVFANPLREAAAPDGGNRLQYVGIILPDGRTLGRTNGGH